MNYRHKLLNQQNKNQISQLEQNWQLERQNLQQDIINLQNSTDLKLLENKDKEIKRLQGLLDDTINLLGSEDIKNLSNISNLLAGRTLKELVQEKNLLNQKIKDQDLALINLAKQKLTGKKDAEKILNQLETKWSKKEIEWEQEKENHARQLAKSRETIANLEKEKKEQLEQIKTLSKSQKEQAKDRKELENFQEGGKYWLIIKTLFEWKKYFSKSESELKEMIKNIENKVDEKGEKIKEEKLEEFEEINEQIKPLLELILRDKQRGEEAKPKEVKKTDESKKELRRIIL